MTTGLAALAAWTLFAQEPASASPPGSERRERKSVLLITLDTTRRDYMGFHGRAPSPTPVLDQLAKASVVFADAVTPVPLTLPAHTSILTGLLPSSHGVRDNSLYRVPDEARSLVEILRERGYATRASVAAFVLDPIFGLDQGFDRYRAPPRFTSWSNEPAREELPATPVVDVAIADVTELARGASAAEGGTPFFYWLHLFDAHYPYAAPDQAPLPPEVAADAIRAGKARYEGEIRFADREIGRLFGALQSLQLLDKMVIVVTADHGESLHDSPEGAHGFFLYDSTVRVPLLVRHPELAPATVTAPVSLVDVAPTLLALLGIDAAGERFDGLDLGPWMRDPQRAPPDRALMLETLFPWLCFGWAPSFGCAHGPLKYIRSARQELYDRARDPAERTNLFATGEPRSLALSRRLDAMLAEAAPLAQASAGLTEEDRQRLQKLAYVAAGSSGEEVGSAAALPADWTSLPDTLQKIAVMDRFNEVMLAVADGKPDRAAELLRALVKQEPGSATIREQLGVMLLNAGRERAEEAAVELDAALAIDPRRSRCWFARAQCDEILAGRFHAEAKALRDQGKAKEARVPSEKERGAVEHAELALRRSLDCEPDFPNALTMLARILINRGERALRQQQREAADKAFAEADALLARALTVLPPNSTDWTDTATLRKQLERLAK